MTGKELYVKTFPDTEIKWEDALEMTQDRFDSAAYVLDNLVEPLDNWISVEEKPPKDKLYPHISVEVILQVKPEETKRYMTTAFYNFNSDYWSASEKAVATHEAEYWQPLPKARKDNV